MKIHFASSIDTERWWRFSLLMGVLALMGFKPPEVRFWGYKNILRSLFLGILAYGLILYILMMATLVTLFLGAD